MGWVFRLEPLLEEFNAQRLEEGRTPITWGQLAPLLGMSRQALQNLASNRELKATNTRFLETFCRFFGKEIHDVVRLAPPLEPGGADQDEVDRLIALGVALEAEDRPSYHVEELYSHEMGLRWRQDRDAEGA